MDGNFVTFQVLNESDDFPAMLQILTARKIKSLLFYKIIFFWDTSVPYLFDIFIRLAGLSLNQTAHQPGANQQHRQRNDNLYGPKRNLLQHALTHERTDKRTGRADGNRCD